MTKLVGGQGSSHDRHIKPSNTSSRAQRHQFSPGTFIGVSRDDGRRYVYIWELSSSGLGCFSFLFLTSPVAPTG
ncbi:hypothetical protein FOFC_09547 [Fusarium oxysporum]|nr:hypothetical protein FOFC_09547 [Fusarium oxysporum]